MNAQFPVIAAKTALRRPWQLLTSVLSLRYFLLRSSTAGAAVIAGLVQTFVFARVLTPERFSIFILIGTFGVSLWLFDLGAAKILFVRQRGRHLGHRADDTVAAHSTAVVVLYGLIVLAGTLLCLALSASWPSVTPWHAVEYAMFFSFSALNLVWYPLRNVAGAVDDFIYFERLEAIRRIGHIAAMLALLVGLSLPAFLIFANLLWFALFGICIARLLRAGALSPQLTRFGAALLEFWQVNRLEILRSGTFAGSELAIYTFPYLVVPMAFGLGAPTIILDTVFKVFRGTTLIYAAGLDPLIPQQTRAFAERDAPKLKRATLTAAVLIALPTLALCAVLIVAGDTLFTLLLGHAATVPPTAVLILLVLLLANMAQNLASCLLQHTGFFREMAHGATFLVIAMAAMTTAVLAAGLDITGFLAGYAVVYIAGAAVFTIYLVRGPFHTAALPAS